MNYTLKQLQERVNKLIEQQGEDAYCGAWIYTKEDCMIRDKDDDEPVFLPEEINSELSERIFNDVGRCSMQASFVSPQSSSVGHDSDSIQCLFVSLSI